MEIYDSEDIKVYMLTKRILFSVMLIVSPSVVPARKRMNCMTAYTVVNLLPML